MIPADCSVCDISRVTVAGERANGVGARGIFLTQILRKSALIEIKAGEAITIVAGLASAGVRTDGVVAVRIHRARILPRAFIFVGAVEARALIASVACAGERANGV